MQSSPRPVGDLGKSGFTAPERQRTQIHAICDQQVEGHVCRTVISEQQLNKLRAVGVVEDDELAVEHKANGQEVEHLLEAPHAVAVVRDQLAADSVGRGAEAVVLGFEEPVRMVERLWPSDRI